MGSTIALIFLVFLKNLHHCIAQDIQCQQPYTFIEEVWRTTANEIEETEKPKCDRNYIVDNTWYRFNSTAGNRIPTTNPGFRKCGTYIPIWMKGRHPTVDEGVVDAIACAGVPFRLPHGCGISYNIKVVNCTGFYLYQLKSPQQCALAYCAGSEEPDSCSITGASLPVCPGIVPIVKTVTADFFKEETQFVRLNCEWEYDGTVLNVEFHVRWIGDVFDPKRQINKTFNGTEKRQYLYEHEWARTENSRDANRQNYAFDKEAFCEVRSRFIGGSWSKWMKSRKIYTGIMIYPQIINLEECGREENRKVYINLAPHLPVRKNDVKIDIVLKNDSVMNRVCLRGVVDKGECQIRLKGEHSSTSPLRIMIRASCSQLDADTGYSSVSVKFKKQVWGDNNQFWMYYEFPEIKIIVTKSTKRICKSVTDPHFTTFDGRRYDFFGTGTFLLYYNKHIGTRIEARQKSCGGSFASCNCGIAIKEGPFYRIYDMCQVDNTNDGTPWWKNPQNLFIRKRGLKDSSTNGFFVDERPDGSSTTYQIDLPSGVMVTIQRKFWGLSTYIKAPTPFDQKNKSQDHYSEGLCGNYNGDFDDDFAPGEEAKFAETYRINGESLFDYKGEKNLEEKILEDCKKAGEICCCESGKSVCGGNAIEKCFPSEKGKRSVAVNAGLCRGTTKRDLGSQDDDEDDQDDIPPFDPPQQNVTPVPSWPTPGGLTEVDVKKICDKKIRYSKAGEDCGNITGVDLNVLVRQCISDIQATDNVVWAMDNFAAMQETCRKNIYKNTSFYQNSKDGELKLDTTFIASLCPSDCSGHGNCSNATCTCDEFYTAADCSISLKDKPYISAIRKNGLCDMRTRPCGNVRIYGFPFLNSKNLTCHVQEYKVIESTWTPNNFTSFYPGQQVDLTEVKCLLPKSPVNIGDYGSEGVTVAGLKIKVSNNGVNASAAHMLFMSYDSVCQECSTVKGCRLKTDACFISGHCFAQNESHPEDWCQQCLPHISNTSWLARRDNQKPSFTSSNVLYAFRGKQLQVQLRAIDPEYRTIRYSFAQNETFGASLTENGFFTWVQQTNYSTKFLFQVTDECGAYSVLKVSIIIKECPCQNSGECLLDYRDLDGVGNFTCSCPGQYTGALCDADANECALFKPCVNGTCNNEQPGFSCSCFAGYTGDLCQNEIDECASSPCFLGVPCTDKIASFRCGNCPNEYSGDGQTCNRIDGRVDECVKNPQVCHNNANCAYNNGSYVCECANGYTGDGMTDCTDVNECQQSPSVCHPMAKCSNIDGSFSCQCNIGYTGYGYDNCTDVDECSQFPSVCHKYSECSNTFGSYSCQCKKGFLGDGVQNCAENQPPQFTIPKEINVILNNEIQIQVMAKDPENQDMTFTLLPNGTLSTVQIMRQLLTISNVKQNGTVYVQVEDEMGAKTLLILQVNAIKCPCKHYGKCYLQHNISYPVRPSDYLCQCDDPYTSQLCEKRPNPCHKLPCYPGLECFRSLDSEGFTCEKCPPSFQGDGKHCELKPTKEQSLVKSEIKLTNHEWNDNLKRRTSNMSKKLVFYLTYEIRNIYKRHAAFSYVIIKGFRRGSVIVDFEMIFTKKIEDPLKPLMKVVETGKLGNMTVEMVAGQVREDKGDSREERMFGLSRTIFYVVVAAAVIVILVIIFAVYLRIKRHRTHRKFNLRTRILDTSDHKAQRFSFRPVDIGSDEDIDLNILDKESICLTEEIKLQP